MFKIFGSKTAPALKALRDVIRKNETDDTWALSLTTRAAEVRRQFQLKLDALAKAPSDAAVDDVLAAGSKLHQFELFGECSRVVSPAIEEQRWQRTRPAVEAALQELIERLEESRDELAAADRKTAQSFGLDHSETVSPVTAKIDAELNRANALLTTFRDQPDNGRKQLRSTLEFILSHS